MQIVIDIDEDTYKEIKKIVANGNEMCFMQKLIAKGTPLPKGHGRLIDCDLLQNAMYDLCDEAGTLKDNPWRENPHIDAITDVISFAPTIIEADTEGSESE